MEKNILLKHRLQLLQRLSELKKSMATINVELTEAAESHTSFLQDPLDHAREQTDLRASFEIHEKYINERKEIMHALERIDNGSFGECDDCGEMISSRRLLVQPSALLCLECQRYKEGFTVAVMAKMPKLNPIDSTPFNYSREEIA